jgi:hypothetical protein
MTSPQATSPPISWQDVVGAASVAAGAAQSVEPQDLK